MIPTLIEAELMEWVIDMLKNFLKNKVHIFCLDFSSALLANIVGRKDFLLRLTSTDNYVDDDHEYL